MVIYLIFMNFIILILLIITTKAWDPLDPVERFCDITFMYSPVKNTICKSRGNIMKTIPKIIIMHCIERTIDENINYVSYKFDNMSDKIKDCIDYISEKLEKDNN